MVKPVASNKVVGLPTWDKGPLTGEALFQALGDNAYELDDAFRFLTFNAGCEAYYGIAASAALGRPIWDVLPPTRGSELEPVLRAAMTARHPARIEMAGIVHPDRWIEVTLFPTARGLGVAFRDRTAEHRAEQALRESEERLRLAQDAGEVGSWDWDIGTGQLHWSESCHRLHGTDPARPPSLEEWRIGIHPEDRPGVEEALRSALAGKGAAWAIEFRFSRISDGALRWIGARGSIVRNPADNRPVRVLGVALDLTERRDAEERQALLARELDHRAKNALAVVQAAVRLTPKDDASAFARVIQGRVGALARAHTLLAEARWSGADLRALAEAELTAFLPSEGATPCGAPRAVLDGPPVRLGPTAVQALSMALHELATNATKYGALSGPEGRLSLSWTVDRAAGLLCLRWAETGGPPLAGPPARAGFGTRVLKATLCDQLGGTVDRCWEVGGLVCRIELPLMRTFSQEVDAAAAAGPV
jgi:PAS domain S-box-containing protein